MAINPVETIVVSTLFSYCRKVDLTFSLVLGKAKLCHLRGNVAHVVVESGYEKDIIDRKKQEVGEYLREHHQVDVLFSVELAKTNIEKNVEEGNDTIQKIVQVFKGKIIESPTI